MEFMIVLFPVMRGVRVDGALQGWTNTVLQLEAGEHDVTLDAPRNFSPVWQHIMLENTSALAPYRIQFHVLPASAIPPSPGSS
ncbi:MAG TPA: hypothetical protein VEL75_04395 [Candidatus Methylomirabilis sp.]|nr:hypothetical protein [Candidatus Methylomirabilis sp.]